MARGGAVAREDADAALAFHKDHKDRLRKKFLRPMV
jgi:hypothetical protein